MRIEIDSSEVGRLAVDLAKAPGRVQRKASLAIRKTALDIQADAKIQAPVDTGNLKNSISSDIEMMSAEVGPTAEYGHYVEEGTRYQAPQPYLRPAFDRRVPGLVRALGASVEDIL